MLSAVALIIGLAALTLVGDYMLKLASLKSESFAAPEFIAGAMMYALTAAGWVIAMKHMTLAALGVYFSVMIILMLAALGVFVFKETLAAREMLGIVLAIVALGLMSRFS
jgi:drug/metabolite transporter (DMT)-like permease